MEDVVPFGWTVLLVSACLLLAVLSNRVSERIRVPAPVLFLIAAAVAADLWPRLGSLSITTDERIVTVALIVILFEGGTRIGRARFATALGGILWVGVLGTVLTAAALGVAAHLLGFEWRTALLLGTALAPTDPAVVFSVLGRREIEGRSGTLLEGESGVNDPVGIALMVALLGATGSDGGSGVRLLLGGLGEFGLQLAVGGLVGLVGARAALVLLRHVPLPAEALYPVRALACAPLVYGLAAVLHGSGFLAVFVLGILLGDRDFGHRRQVDRFAAALAAVAEIVAFVVLGLPVPASEVLGAPLWQGLALAAVLVLVVRPLAVGPLVAVMSLRTGERLFVLWAGLRGAVPILLGTYLLSADVPDGRQAYTVVFVVVLLCVVVQGGLVRVVARRLGVPMREVPPGGGPARV